MDTTPKAAHKENTSFIIRLWLEPHEMEGQRWRGHIRHVQSPAEAYFNDFSRLLQFVEIHAGIPLPLKLESPARD